MNYWSLPLYQAAERSSGHSFLGEGAQQFCAAYFKLQLLAELEKTMTGGKKMPKKKKITDSNKFSYNGLKNKMPPKQVQLKVRVQKAYGQWECVGALVRGARCPLLPGHPGGRGGVRGDPGGVRWGRAGACTVPVCAFTCVLHSGRQGSGQARECVGVLGEESFFIQKPTNSSRKCFPVVVLIGCHRSTYLFL